MATRHVPGNARLLKELNQFQVLDGLRRHGSMARSELARLTGLTAPTVGLIVGHLLEEGLLLEQAGQPGLCAGRRAVPLAINPRAGVAVGVQIGPSEVQVVAIDLGGSILARSRFILPGAASPHDLVHDLVPVVRGLVAKLRPPRVLGIGLGIAPLPRWRGSPFTTLLVKALAWPMVADSDVRCTAFGELWFGAGRDVQNFVCLHIGSSIGSGIVLGGSLYRGADGTAGEIGHLTVDLTGPLCACGSYGCLETVASGPGIAAKAIRMIRGGASSALTTMASLDAITAELVAKAAALGDGPARQVLQEAGTYLGVAVANLIKTLNPELILVGGEVAQAGDLLLEPIRHAIAARTTDRVIHVPPIRPIQLGAEAGAVGAAAMVLERFFKGGAVPAALEWLA